MRLLTATIVGVLLLACNAPKDPSSGSTTHTSATPSERPAEQAPTPAKKQLVSDSTIREFTLLNDIVAAHRPSIPPEPIRSPEETTVAFEARSFAWRASVRNTLAKFQNEWGAFDLKKYTGARTTSLDHELGQHRADMSLHDWECTVVDVRYGGSTPRIHCALMSGEDWAFTIEPNPYSPYSGTHWEYAFVKAIRVGDRLSVPRLAAGRFASGKWGFGVEGQLKRVAAKDPR